MSDKAETVHTNWDGVLAGTLVVNDKGEFGVVAKTLDGRPVIIRVDPNMEGWVVERRSGVREN